MMAAALSSKSATLLPRGVPSRKHAPVARAPKLITRATAARDERNDNEFMPASGILGGDWAPTWSLGLPARPARRGSSVQASSTRNSASDEGIDVEYAISGEWDGRSCSLATFEDVVEYLHAHKSDYTNRHH